MWHLPRRKKKHGVVLFFFFFFFFSSRRRTGTRHQPCQIYIGVWTHHTHKHLPAVIGYTKRGKEAWCAREMFKYIPTCPFYICRASAVPGTHLLGKKKKKKKIAWTNWDIYCLGACHISSSFVSLNRFVCLKSCLKKKHFFFAIRNSRAICQ